MARVPGALALPFLLFLRIPALLVLIITQVVAQNGPSGWTATPFNAPALPLAVRSPYLNSWLAQGNKPAQLNQLWSNLWPIGSVTGWFAIVVVDGQAYRIMGLTDLTNVTVASQTAVEFTATRTSFIFTAGPMQINASFISPIEPTDLARQSLPFSYFSMSASSTDGNSHALRMYSDISGEFITSDTSKIATWNSADDGEYTILSMQLQTQQQYSEGGDRSHALDATEYYTFKKISGTSSSWAITEDLINRNRAANMTNLGNQQDVKPRAVRINWPTLGIAVDWPSISTTPEPAVWGIGVVRSPSIQYRSASRNEDRYPYFLSTWNDPLTAAKAFLDDYARASTTAAALDLQLKNEGSIISSEYADLLALSARQVFSSLDITISRSGNGDWNISDTKVFMKNMGSGGSDGTSPTMSVNTVDILYAAFPVFLYLNPELGGYLLSPLLEYQDSSEYTLTFAAKNIGSQYPNATADGITDTHDYRVEETANMLIMTLAYSQRSGNGTLISRHYTLLRSWAEYLENNTLTPTNQKSADFYTGSGSSTNNQTNIALKGIIGIASMAKMAEYAGTKGDQARFNGTATSYVSQWQSNALASDNSHVDFVYGQSDTNGLIYNLYADKLLKLGLVSDQVYQVSTVFYNNIASQARYGLSLDDGDSGRTTTHWMAFAASTVTDLATRDYMVNQIHDYASSNQNNTPFSCIYNPTTGVPMSGDNAGKNSPAVGGLFAFLALNTTIQSSIDIPSEGSTIADGGGGSSSSKSNAGAIAGGVVGGLVGLGLVGSGIFFCMRRRNRQMQAQYDTRMNPAVPGMVSVSSPTSYTSSGRGMGGGKIPGLNESAMFEPFRYQEGTHNVSGSQANLIYTGYMPGGIAAPVAADAALVYSQPAQNVRDSTYFRTHRPGESDDLGPSASQIGSSTSSGTGRGSRSGRGHSTSQPTSDRTTPQHVMIAKQSLVNDELRSEVDNLRRDLERIQEERRLAGGTMISEEAPPSYEDPV